MLVKRITVEEGFLHGLDLSLDEGLTVLVGARGSGKTSIIELTRFALGVPAYAEGQAEVSRNQALAVLSSGRVTVTLDVEGEEIQYTRSADEEEPRRSSDATFPAPIVLSQNEIEQVGRHADSRLRLLDSFVSSLGENERSESAARALISSLTVELRNLTSEIRALQEEIARLAHVPSTLAEAKVKATEATSNLEQARDQRSRLDQIAAQLASAGVRNRIYDRVAQTINERLRVAQPLSQPTVLDPWPDAAASADELAPVRLETEQATEMFQSGVTLLRHAAARVQTLQTAENQQQIALEDEARTLRSFIDQLSQGAGALIKTVSDLETLYQRSVALKEMVANQLRRAEDVRQRRDAELDRLDALRDSRVNSREETAAFLNSKVGPRVRIAVNRFGSVTRYADAIAEALRGSGVQYNILAPELARSISPRELAIAAENNDPDVIANVAGISTDRAQRIVNHLCDVGTETILTAPLDDTVQLFLLDGGTYKAADELSVGQRCTAVLPIMLSHTERVLIVDQPEDNLDNSFVADTLVKALRSRPSTSQLMFATHNPNVPVLGEADRVVHMISDGRRGEVLHAAPLDDPESVRAITDIMEGGREAFATRAAFYAQAPLD